MGTYTNPRLVTCVFACVERMVLPLFQTPSDSGSKLPLRWSVIVTGQQVFLAQERGQIMRKSRRSETTRGRRGRRQCEESEKDKGAMRGTKSEGKPKPPGCCWLAPPVFRAQMHHLNTHPELGVPHVQNLCQFVRCWKLNSTGLLCLGSYVVV